MSDAAPTPAKAGWIRRYWLDVPLWRRILIGLVLGIIVGLFLRNGPLS